jgi:hypothetical protein
MPDRRFRVLAVATHPLQNSAPLFRRMACQQLDFHIACCSLRGAEPGHDPKRPLDLLQAFLRLNLANARLVFAGDGPVRSRLEAEASALAALLENAVAERWRLQALGERGVVHIRTRSAERNITATMDAIQSAVARKSRVVRAADKSPVPAAKSSITGARRP